MLYVYVSLWVSVGVFYTPAAAESVHAQTLASTWRRRARANIKILQSALSMVHKLQRCAFRAVNVRVWKAPTDTKIYMPVRKKKVNIKIKNKKHAAGGSE